MISAFRAVFGVLLFSTHQFGQKNYFNKVTRALLQNNLLTNLFHTTRHPERSGATQRICTRVSEAKLVPKTTLLRAVQIQDRTGFCIAFHGCKILNQVQDDSVVGMFDKNRRAAFTLAEVLITLGIIGIIAILTIPSLINKITDLQYKEKKKKNYSVFAQAMKMVEIEDNMVFQKEENWTNLPIYLCKLAQHLKAVKNGLDCSIVLSDEFDPTNDNSFKTDFKWHNEWYQKDTKPIYLNPGYNSNTFQLQDGTLINYGCLNQVFIDVNGFKKPNTVGKDIFYFLLTENGLTFWENAHGNIINACNSEYSTLINSQNYLQDCETGSGWGCSPKYIFNK